MAPASPHLSRVFSPFPRATVTLPSLECPLLAGSSLGSCVEPSGTWPAPDASVLSWTCLVLFPSKGIVTGKLSGVPRVWVVHLFFFFFKIVEFTRV